MLASAALRASSGNSELLLTSQAVLPQIEKYSPSLAPKLRRQIAYIKSKANQPKGDVVGSSVEQSEQSVDEPNRPPTNDERVAELIRQAKFKMQADDKMFALNLLNQALDLSGGHPRNPAQLHAQLQIAQIYAGLDSTRSFALMERIIAQLNELATAAVIANGFLIDEEVARDDELRLLPLFESVNGVLDQKLADLASFADADFGRTKKLAESFQRNEVRILAYLLIVESLMVKGQPSR